MKIILVKNSIFLLAFQMLIEKNKKIYNIKSELLPNGINAPSTSKIKEKNLNLITYFFVAQ